MPYRFWRALRPLALAAACVLTAPSPTLATVVSSGVNDPLGFGWSYDTGSLVLTGSGSMAVSGFNSGTLRLDITLTNSTDTGASDPTGKNARLASFGFGINPNATGVSFSDNDATGMVGAALDALPSLALIEVCAYGGPNCNGGGNGGLYGQGGSDSFTLLLSGAWGSSVDIAPIGLKVQTPSGSYEFTADTDPSPVPGPLPAPEPNGLALAALGLFALAAARRPRRG